MKIFQYICFVIFMVASTTMKAQNIISQLEAEGEGLGIIEIQQDERLTDILNGLTIIPSTVSTGHQGIHLTTEGKLGQDGESMTRTSGVHQKARGYRVQVFFGTNQRADQTKAQQMGNKVTRQFPELRAYTSFESPHWRCRVGDFTNRNDASNYMRRLKAKGFSEAMVVQSEIYVSADQLR